MKTIHKLLLLLTLVTMMACEEPIEPLVNESNKLMGFWVNPIQVDTCWRYERAFSFNEGGYGFFFNDDHLFAERKNTGWCGTPPVTYGNFEGTYSRNDSLLTISVEYWGGIANYQWKIITLDDKYLTIYKVKEEFGNQE